MDSNVNEVEEPQIPSPPLSQTIRGSSDPTAAPRSETCQGEFIHKGHTRALKGAEESDSTATDSSTQTGSYHSIIISQFCTHNYSLDSSSHAATNERSSLSKGLSPEQQEHLEFHIQDDVDKMKKKLE